MDNNSNKNNLYFKISSILAENMPLHWFYARIVSVLVVKGNFNKNNEKGKVVWGVSCFFFYTRRQARHCREKHRLKKTYHKEEN